MTTEKDFCDATAQWNSNVYGKEIAWVCEPEDVVRTRAPVADFETTFGAPREVVKTIVGDLHVWQNVQARYGARRGEVFVLACVDGCLSYFDGEV